MNGQRKRILCNAILSLLFLSATAFAETWSLQYNAVKQTPAAEQASMGWEEFSSTKASSMAVKDGILHMETKTPAGSYWIGMKQRTDAWGYAIAPGRDWTVETKVRVTKSGGEDGGFTLWVGNGNRQTAYLVIGRTSLSWGLRKQRIILSRTMDNHSEFHTYRVSYNADAQTFTVSRDGRRVKSGLKNAVGIPYRWFAFGDMGGTCSMTAEIDWLRYKTEGGPNLYTGLLFGDVSTSNNDVLPGHLEHLPAALKRQKAHVAFVNSARTGLHSGKKIEYRDPRRRGTPQGLDVFEDEVLKFEPDIAVLQFGLNDSWIDTGKVGGPSRTPLERFAYNLDTMILTLLDAGTKVVLMTPNPLGTKHPAWRDVRLGEYAQVIRNIAKREGLPLVDMRRSFKGERRGVDAFIAEDGMLPNTAGYKLMADELAATLAGIVKPPTFQTYDLSKQLPVRSVATRNAAQLVQVNTAKLPGDRLVAVYQKRTKTANQVLFARSTNGGSTWTELPPSPTFKGLDVNTPTLHTAGDTLFLLVSYPRLAVSHSKDAGSTWSPPYPLFPPDWQGEAGDAGILPPASLLHNGSDLLMLYHDATTLRPNVNFALFQTISSNAGRKWSPPDQVSLTVQTPGARPAEPVVVPNPRTGQLLCIAKDASRKYPALWMASDNGGKNWSGLLPTNELLSGDRFAGIRTRDGRLLLVYRDRRKGSKWYGDTVAWVGTDDALKRGGKGQYHIRLIDNPGQGGTADIEQLTDGAFIVTSAYAFKTSSAVRCVRFTVEQLDHMSANRRK